MKTKYPISALAVSIAALVSGCASLGMPDHSAINAKDMVNEIAAKPATLSTLLEKNNNTLTVVDEVDRDPSVGSFSYTGSGALKDVLAAVPGYSVNYADGVSPSARVSVNITRSSEVSALRRIAAAAGFVAIVNQQARTVTIAEQGVFTFKLPQHAMQALEAQYNFGGDPAQATADANSSNSGSGSSSSSSSNSMKAEFTVKGKAGVQSAGLITFLTALAGANAQVTVSPEMGMVTVRSNGTALARVHDFLNKFATTAMRRIDIKTSLVEAELTDSNDLGIDWTRVLSSRGLTATISGAASIANPALKLNYAKGSITSVINAMREQTSVRVLTQPNISALNHAPSLLFQGSQFPYVGNLTSTVSQTSTQVSGSVSYAVDGISLSVLPDIFSDTKAQIIVAPVVKTLGEEKTFALGDNHLTAYQQTQKNALMSVEVETGRTVILGGIRYVSNTRSRSGIAFTGLDTSIGNNGTTKELVILINATVLPSSAYETLFTESL